MKTAAWLLLAGVLALLVSPVGAQQPPPPGLMDRVAKRFKPGRPMSFVLMFESLETAHDLDVNTTIADAREKKDEKGRSLLLATESYTVRGVRHRFVFVIREGLLALFDLQRQAGDEWDSVPQDEFWFQMLEEKPPTDFLESGEAVLYARGACNQGRGSATRARATVALRSFHAEAGGPPRY